MKIPPLFTQSLLAVLLAAGSFAQEAARPASDIKSEMNAIFNQAIEKMKTAKPTAATLAAELAAFDTLLAKYPGKNDDTGNVAMMKAFLYLQIGDEETGEKLLAAVVADYAGTRAATASKKMLESLTPEAKAKAKADKEAIRARQAALIGAPAPQLDFTWASTEGLKSLADLKGKVVVLDFWATWCGPCIAAFPKIRKEVAHFKGSPVVVLGVTSLQGRVNGIEPKPIEVKGNPAREYELTAEFMKKQEMSWPVAFSKQEVYNPDYAVRGIPHLTIIDPTGKVRHNGMNPHDPTADVVGKVTAILKEFNLPAPPAKS